MVAATVLIAQLFYVMSVATAKQRDLLAQKRQRDLRVLVASGDEVAGKQNQRAGAQEPRLARTGVEIDGALSLGLVLMLDGALVLMALRPKRVPF